MNKNLFEKIQTEIEKKAIKEGKFFPGDENVRIVLELTEAELEEWNCKTCSEIIESEHYEYEFIENVNTGNYDLCVNYSYND